MQSTWSWGLIRLDSLAEKRERERSRSVIYCVRYMERRQDKLHEIYGEETQHIVWDMEKREDALYEICGEEARDIYRECSTILRDSASHRSTAEQLYLPLCPVPSPIRDISTIWCLRPYEPYIFWKLLIQEYQNYQFSYSQIHKYKYTNTQLHRYNTWRSARNPKHVVYFWKEDFSGESKIIHV